MVFFAKDRFRANGVRVDPFNEEQSDLTVSYSLNLHELFDIDLLVQAQLCFFINLSQRAVYTGFTLINFSLRKIELAHDTISWVMIDDEEEAVEGAVEDQGAIRRNLRLVKAIVFP